MDPWGSRQPPMAVGRVPALPSRLAALAQVQSTGIPLSEVDPYTQGLPAAWELPEVQELMERGWRPLDSAPLYCLLPAAWPPEHRTWVADRLPHVEMTATTDFYWGAIVALPDADSDSNVVDNARRAGLPDPPADRIWLLRSPWPQIPITVIQEVVWSVVARASGEDEVIEVYRVARDVLTWPKARVLAACRPETRELLDVWARAGRTGEAAGEVIERRLLPADLADAVARTRLDEQILLDWLASLQTGLDDEVIGFINAWRTAQLPGNPPARADRFLGRDPAELRSWLDMGFDLYAAAQLEPAGLTTAIRWRQAGFSEADTYDLLRADPALTPAEARAFDLSSAGQRRREWIYYGFSPAEAADWTATGIGPADARLWRACGHRPADVRPGQRIPPHLADRRQNSVNIRTASGGLIDVEGEDLPDPPGTRGRRARRSAGDDDPWINTD